MKKGQRCQAIHFVPDPNKSIGAEYREQCVLRAGHGAVSLHIDDAGRTWEPANYGGIALRKSGGTATVDTRIANLEAGAWRR